MRVNYRTNASSQFQILSRDQCQEVYVAALKVLRHTGIVVHCDEALEILEENGARVEGERIYIPSFMVERALLTAPTSFTIYSREGDDSKNIEIGPNRPHFGPSATATHVLDPRTGERRLYQRKDAIAAAIVADALPNIDYVASMGTISEVDQRVADVHEFAAMIAHTGKPIMGWSYTLDGCRDVHRIAVAVAGGGEEFISRPNYFFFCEPIPPLTCTGESAEKVIYCARHGVPFIFAPVLMGGASAPATLAGGVVMSIVESMLGLVLSQILRPGTPYGIGGTNSILDMKTSLMPYGAPELSVLCGASAEVAHYLGLPHWSTSGATDAKVVDGQAAIEGTISNLFAGLCASDLSHNVGFIEACMTGSLLNLVMMDESISYVKRILQGIEVNEDTLAVDLIAEIGPGGDFSSAGRTARYARSHFWKPTLMDRQSQEEWERSGRKTMGERGREKLVEILDTHRATPLAPEVQAEIDAILAEAERRLQNTAR